MAKWKKLGSGTYNTAYQSQDGRSVLKIQHNKTYVTDSPERSVRIWNELNPTLPPPAYMTHTKHGNGWVCPFVSGDQASDKDMSSALISIYNHSGRIVVDAMSAKNFIKAPNGQVVCVDIGMALQMERREEVRFTRRKSIVSLEAWRDMNRSYDPYFQRNRTVYPETVDTIKALLFIKSNRPDIFDAGFLKNAPTLVTKLARAYDKQGVHDALVDLDRATPGPIIIEPVRPPKPRITPEEVKDGRNILIKERPVTLNNIKESCVKELEKYIRSRGSINTQGDFEPSFITKIFRNKVLIATKIDAAKQLIALINDAGSIDDIQKNIDDLQINPDSLKARFGSGLRSSLGKCLLIIETAKKENPAIALENKGSIFPK